MLIILAALVAALPQAVAQQTTTPIPSSWVRPTKAGDALLWGRRDGILFGLPSEKGLPGPRGLIRIGVISPTTGKPQLLNYIAVEPVVIGPGSRWDRMAFSELEASQLDPGLKGKRLWVDMNPPGSADAANGKLETLVAGDARIERLSVRINVERYSANGAHVYVVASIDSDHPDELQLAVHHYDDSAAIDELTLTATMGNFERLRELYLKNRVVQSTELYRDYQGNDFTEHENYVLDEMLRNSDGDGLAICTTDEANPAGPPAHWPYPLPRLTQYWRVPASFIEPDLRIRVNGRRVYWKSHVALPGGVAFENFELRQRYKPGQISIFGVTPTEPWNFVPAIPQLQRVKH